MSDSLRPHGLQHTRLPWPFSIFQSLLRFVSSELVMLSNCLNLCCPLNLKKLDLELQRKMEQSTLLNAYIPALFPYCLGYDLYKYVDFLISFLCVLIPHFGSYIHHLHTTLQTTTSKFSFFLKYSTDICWIELSIIQLLKISTPDSSPRLR